jgi:SPP1 family predicted phage head-tail adaptor
MRSEKLDRRITLQRYSRSFDADNQPIEVWTPDASPVWASVEYASDGEKARAGEVAATVSVRFQIRWSTAVSTVNPKDRVAYDGKIWDVIGVKELGRREGLEISAAAAADE